MMHVYGTFTRKTHETVCLKNTYIVHLQWNNVMKPLYDRMKKEEIQFNEDFRKIEFNEKKS